MNQISAIEFGVLTEKLSAAGLNLCAGFSTVSLAESMPELALPPHLRNILLIGNAGRRLWEALPAEYLKRDDPVDEYSVDCVNRVLDQIQPSGRRLFLFPDTPAGLKISLQEFGTQAGWHNASPLGIGINASHGLWFAYRAVVAIESDLTGFDTPEQFTADSPCLSCEAKPCLSHCPAQALVFGESPDLSACVAHRLKPGSDCASTCLARMACPVAPQLKYSDDQVAYFYNRSLASTSRWVKQNRE